MRVLFPYYPVVSNLERNYIMISLPVRMATIMGHQRQKNAGFTASVRIPDKTPMAISAIRCLKNLNAGAVLH